MPDPRHAPPLAGRTIVTTRERRGALDTRLEALGATVVHVPLIETREPSDGGAAVAAALDVIDTFDWVVVTSPNGGARVAAALRETPCKIAAVGTRTAEVVTELAGRRPDLVPNRQSAADLVAAMQPAADGQRLLLAQADRAASTAADGFARLGYDVVAVTAYRTLVRHPTATEIESMLTADGVAFASGSAVRAWVDAVGTRTPDVVAVIGPSTESVARQTGVGVSVVAADHSIDGLAAALVQAFDREP